MRMYNVYVDNQRKKENKALITLVECIGMFSIGATWYVMMAILFVY